MKIKIFAASIALLLLLVGCKNETPNKTVTPYSSSVESAVENTSDDTSDESLESDVTDSALGNDSTETVEWDGNSNYEEYTGNPNIAEEWEEETKPSAKVEKNAAVSTLSTKWNNVKTSNFTAGAEVEANALRKKILNTKNTDSYYKWSGKTIYVSPDGDNQNNGLSPKTAVLDLTADVFYENPLKPGDAVLFERGGLWRMTSSISAEEGVTYGSYGKGEKPTFYGSMKNYADETEWFPSKKQNIWKLTVADIDIGLIVFNNGEFIGHKRINGITALDKNLDYYFSEKDDCVYMYYDGGNPGKAFKDIEVCLNKSGFSVGYDNITIDNIRIKYYGRFGISMCDNDNTKITNCEIGFIGGALQNADEGLRYGNGIQQWNSTDKQLIENCWVYQTYDTAITWQGNDSYQVGTDSEGNQRIDDKAYYKDISYIGNLLEYNIMDFETWHDSKSGTCLAKITNFITKDNICRYAGYGWSAIQRADTDVGWAFGRGGHNWVNSKDVIVTNNILDCSYRSLVYWKLNGAAPAGFKISGNTFYQHSSKYYEGIWYGASAKRATDQASLEAAISIFDTAPKKVQWLG